MADEEDYDGGDMDAEEDYADEDQMDDIELEQGDEDGDRVQLIEVRREYFFLLLSIDLRLRAPR